MPVDLLLNLHKIVYKESLYQEAGMWNQKHLGSGNI